jgi:hypothetical protein
MNELGKYRQFGMIVGGMFLLIGAWPALVRGQDMRLWALIIAGMLLIPGLLMPRSLAPIYRIWMAAGGALGWVNTRLILGLIYYLLFTPAGFLMRLMGRDPMRRGRQPDAGTYRVPCHPRPASHMRNQF